MPRGITCQELEAEGTLPELILEEKIHSSPDEYDKKQRSRNSDLMGKESGEPGGGLEDSLEGEEQPGQEKGDPDDNFDMELVAKPTHTGEDVKIPRNVPPHRSLRTTA
ncbi:hypothetical protein XENOCAPTIV_028239, partial [Xenoophorus captivus]